MGSTGEAVHLTRQERASIISKLHISLPNFPIIGGVAQNALQDALDELESIKRAGASYGVVLPSSYFGASSKQQGIKVWFTQLADKSPLPILVYVYPGVSNNIYVDPATIVKFSAHPNIVGCKISHGDVPHHTIVGSSEQVSKNNFHAFMGLGQILLPVLNVGCKGAIDALSGAFPKVYVELFKAFEAGDYEKAKKLQYIATRGEELVVKFGVIGIKKNIFLQGFGETYLGRAPLNQDLDANAWDALIEYYNDIAALEATL